MNGPDPRGPSPPYVFIEHPRLWNVEVVTKFVPDDVVVIHHIVEADSGKDAESALRQYLFALGSSVGNNCVVRVLNRADVYVPVGSSVVHGAKSSASGSNLGALLLSLSKKIPS